MEISDSTALNSGSPVITAAPADDATRAGWLDRLWEACEQDDIPYLEGVGDAWGGLDVALRQDLTYGFHLFAPDVQAGATPLQRLPAVAFAVPETALAGPLHGSLQ